MDLVRVLGEPVETTYVALNNILPFKLLKHMPEQGRTPLPSVSHSQSSIGE